MAELFANSGDPDQRPRSIASDLGLHCLPITHLRVSRLQWVKTLIKIVADNNLFFYLFIYFSEKIRLGTLIKCKCMLNTFYIQLNYMYL